MKAKLTKSLSVILALIIAVSAFSPAFAVTYNATGAVEEDFEPNGLYGYLTAEDINPEELSNSVVIPGVFQSRTRLYNEDGTLALNSDGEEYSAPFFLDTTKEIVMKALKKILVPLLVTLVTRIDFGGRLAKGFGEGLGEILGGKIYSDNRGKLAYNVKADKYNECIAKLTQEEKDYIYDQIPLIDYADVVGEDHLYFYSYCSFGNLNETVDELYELIQKAASESPTGKANIIPISQGGSLATNLLERHPEVGEILDRIIYIVPALDGTIILGELYAKGLIDDNYSLYQEMFPILIDEEDTPWLGHLVNVALHLLPNKVVQNMLDVGVDGLIGYLKYSTSLWGLVDSENYTAAANKYLSGNDDAFIRAQTDQHYQGQLNRFKNIRTQIDEYDVEVFDIVDYNYAMYPIVDSWKAVNADGIIHVASTSMGATSYGVDVKLPDNYTPAKGEKYVDSYNIIDAGTGLLPDTTFYFHNQDHESTARNDIIIKLAVSLLTDNDFTSIESYPEQYPQFNETRDGKGLAGDARKMHEMLASDDISENEKADLEYLMNKALVFLNNTTNSQDDLVEFKKTYDGERDRILYHHEPAEPHEPTFKDKAGDAINNGATAFLKALSYILYKMTR